MNSNRLYNLFSKRKLRRENIRDYSNATELEKNQIEQAAMSHSFDTDAMEGWESMSMNIGVMQNLDKKFTPKSNQWLYWMSGSIAAIIIIGIFLYPVSKPEIIAQNETQSKQIESISIEKTDVLLPDSIEEMEETPIEKQVSKDVLIKPETKEIIEVESTVELEAETEANVEIEKLPVRKIEQTKTEIIINKQKKAKEIYLNDFKLIDYRSYRSKPVITVERMILGGTPANKEDEHSSVFEYEWEDYNIPYIDYIDKTTAYLAKNKLKKALQRCQTILKTYHDDINANFYAGFCLMNLNEYSQAIEHFQKVKINRFSNFNEEANWLEALCYEQISPSKAKAIFSEIASKKGFYASQAEGKLK